MCPRKMVGKGGGGDDKRLHSLMNLVMQFRKICRHVAAVEHYPVSDSPSSREFSSFEQLQSLLEGNC